MRAIILAVCMLACISASGQEAGNPKAGISIDMASIITDMNIRFGFSHYFCGNWSAEGGMSLQIPGLRKKTEEEAEHDGTLAEEGRTEAPHAEPAPGFRIGIRYWPGKSPGGGYIEIACHHDLKSGTDLHIGGGYVMKIWGGIGISIGYGAGLFESIRTGKFGTSGVNIGLNYSF